MVLPDTGVQELEGFVVLSWEEDEDMGQNSGDGCVLGVETGFPYIYSPVYHTERDVPYLRAPGVHLISKPQVDLDSIRTFLSGFDKKLEFWSYMDDPDELEDGEALIKFAGQACYASFGPKRTKNAEAAKYLNHIKESGHGSVTEHANYSMFIYGVSRAVTHELVRHRAGTGFSQLSQRYVSGKVLRFVERSESQTDADYHEHFERWVEASVEEYDWRANRLLERQSEGDASLTAERRTDLRKKVQQAARDCLPNETETFLVMTGNVRAWRHTCEMRANEAADTQIRELFVRIYKCLKVVAPLMFSDYSLKQLGDGTLALDTPHRKV